MLAAEPERNEQVVTCIRAWSDLSTERSIGMAVGPVPWSRIVRWCEFHGLDHDASSLLIYVIRDLDNRHAAAEAAKRAADAALGRRGAR